MGGINEKDVECTFGILKGRFRILKIGIRVHSITATDNIWYTCCASHNMFLIADGLDKEWDTSVETEWEGELGLNDVEDFEMHATNELRTRYHTEYERSHLNLTGIGPGNDDDWIG
jgi:Plant transposon protein